MIRNIIFDWSGTLVDDLPAVWQASNAVLRRAGVAEQTLDQFRAEFCLPFRQFYDRFTPHLPLEQLESWFYDAFRQLQDLVTEIPQAREFLVFCRQHKIQTFLLSSVHATYFDLQSARTGFRAYLDHPYVAIGDKRLSIRELVAQHQLASAETLLVGDMQHDIETAHWGGVRACAVLTGYNRRAQLEASQPDLIVANLGELRRHLESQQMNIRDRPRPLLPQATPVPTRLPLPDPSAIRSGAFESMLDQIIIRDLAVHFQVGVSEAERSFPQRLLLTLELTGDFSAAAASDHLSQALDYDALVRRLLAWGEGRSWHLLEALAAEVARLVLAEFNPAAVTVEIKKFALPQTAHVAVRLTRSRPADTGAKTPDLPG